MATLTQIIFIFACACIANCRYTPGRLHIHQPQQHQETPTTTLRDSDAVVFPSDDDSKNVQLTIVNQDNGVGAEKPKTDAKVDDAPLLSKVKPAVEGKDVFNNSVAEDIDKANVKIVNEKDKIVNPTSNDVNPVAVQTDVRNNGTEIKLDDAVKANQTIPDLSSRFGSTGYGNYLLVPVANNQNNQPIQTNANVPYYNYNTQGIANQPASTQFANAGNIGPNQYLPNVGQSQYGNVGQQNAPIVFNPSSQPSTYVPVNVPNTYVINGQLYAAVTVPNDNMEVISPMYYVNPQTSAYQVQNNVPLYQLVTVNSGSPQYSNNLNNMNSNSQIVGN